MVCVMPPASFVDDVGVAQGVEQLRLAVVDVTHDRDDRRTRGEILLDAFVLAELEAERLQQLAVLFLRRDDLDVVVELLAEDLQDVVVDRLRGGDHLTEVEQHLHQRCRVGTDLVGEVAQRGAAGEPDRLALALADAHAADGGRLHLVEFLTLGALALATAPGRAAGTTEGALRAAATATAGTAGTTTGAAEAATGTSAAGAAEAAIRRRRRHRDDRRRPVLRGRRRDRWDDHRGHRRATRATLAGGGSSGQAGLPGHHRRVGARHAGTCGRAALGRCRGTRRALLLHALTRGERVVAGTSATGARARSGAGRLLGRGCLVGRRRRRRGRLDGLGGLVDGDLGLRLGDRRALGDLGNLGDLGRLGDLRRCGLGGRPRQARPSAAAFFAGAFLAAFFSPCLRRASPCSSLRRRTTGASTVEDADFTYSPMSCRVDRMILLGTPNSLASSWTRTATLLLRGSDPKEDQTTS